MRARLAFLAAFLTALVAWLALVLQFGLIAARMSAEGHGVGAILWRYFGFFTIIGNLAVAIVASAMTFASDGRLAGPRARLAVAVSIVFIGIVYSVALRAISETTGWQSV